MFNRIHLETYEPISLKEFGVDVALTKTELIIKDHIYQ